jgi:hypothetical protein
MSLKFAAVGSLTVLSPFGLPARPATEHGLWKPARLTTLFSPCSALRAKQSSRSLARPEKEPLTAHAHRRYTFVDPVRSSDSATGFERSAEAIGLMNMPVILR